MSPADEGDDKATFLAEFRTLRNRAAIDCEELAVRAHYPTDVIKDAESGPELPGLPVLAAYVRACGGDVLEWEERWRRLATDADYDSGLPMRPAGASPAAVAGARAGVTIAAAEVHDADRIKAALRAHQEREELAGRTGTTAHQDIRPAARMADPRTAATSPATMIANGNHHKKPHPDGFNAWQAADPQPQAPDPTARDSAAWDPAARAWTAEDPAASAWTAHDSVDSLAEPGAPPLAEPGGTWESGAQTPTAPEYDVWSRSPSSRTRDISTSQDPPTWAPEPSRAPDPSTWTQEPPMRAQKASSWAADPPTWTRDRPIPAREEKDPPAGASDPVARASDMPTRAASTTEVTESSGAAWAASAASESNAAKPPVAAIRAASEAASRVTVAQAAAATAARRSGHRGLLVLAVVVVIIGCIALLSVT